MRHLKKGRKLGRRSQERLALLRNQARSLIIHEKIRTTEAKGKELKRFVDKLISRAKRNDLTARKRVLALLYNDAHITDKVFSILVPRYEKREGGFVRVVKVGPRRGDGASVVQVELV